MFSEYASKYLSKSQRPAPLFNGYAAGGDSDVDNYLEGVAGSTDDGSLSDSGSSTDSMDSQESDNGADPPEDLLIERAAGASRSSRRARRPRHKTGYSLWAKNVAAWQSTQRSTAGPAGPQLQPPPDAPPQRPRAPQSNGAQEATGTAAPAAGSAVRDPELGLGTREQRGSKSVDHAVAGIYLITLALSLATAALVTLTTAPQFPGSIYPVFAYSARALVVYAVLTAVLSYIWLYVMRHHTRAVVQASMFVVPATLVATSLYSVAMSVHSSAGPWAVHGLAHAAMRISALGPLAVALLWVLYLRRVKELTGKAADIVVLSVEIYNQCTPAMTILTTVAGLASLAVTGLWSFFMARAFLEGRIGILLVAWFAFMYLWTWGVLCAMMRSILAGVTAQWYAQGSMEGVLSQCVYESVTYHFGSACLGALVALVVRVPLLVLPFRLTGALQSLTSFMFSTSATRLLDPLTLPTAVIKRCSLSAAARDVNGAEFGSIDRRAYRLAKLFLIAARVCCSLVVGFVAWGHADHIRDVSSAYGYLIAIVALFIGWTVVGAAENMLSMISDSILVCYVVSTAPRRTDVDRVFASEDDTIPTPTSGAHTSLLDDSQSSYSDESSA